MKPLRGHAYFVEFVGRRGGSSWWLALIVVGMFAAGIAQALR